MSEQLEWIEKRLTENRRDAIWGVIMTALFAWFVVSFDIAMTSGLIDIIPTWAMIPLIIVIMLGFFGSICGVLAGLASIAMALRK